MVGLVCGISTWDGREIIADSSTVSGNEAYRGGGIHNGEEGTISIANSTVSGNTTSRGGGIHNLLGTASIANSTVSGNTARTDGGGILNRRGRAIIANSTVSGNTANNAGGIGNLAGTAMIANSTVSGNTAGSYGGGINMSGTNSAMIANSTVSGNTAGSYGGGINIWKGTVSIANSIIAANADNKDLDNGRGGIFTSGGHNLIGNNNDIDAFKDGENGDLVGKDPMLGPLQDNGGATFTHALLAGSPAIDAGNDDNIPTDELDVDGDDNTAEKIDIDQRGEDRIQGGTVDIGAFESPSQIEFSAASYNSNEDVGTSNAVTLTRTGDTSGAWTVQVSITGGTATGGTDYRSSGFPLTVEFAAGETNKTVAVEIVDDPVYEPGAAETITFSVASESNADIGTQSTTTLNISDNDSQPTVSLGLSNSTLAENGGTATVTATLSNESTEDVTVNLGFSGTATGSGVDYTASANGITISAGSTTGSITLTGNDDVIDEADETIIVDIDSVTNGTEDGIGQETLTINDDDAAAAQTLSINDVTVDENAGTASFTVSLDAASGQTITVDYATADGTALSPDDYTSSSGTLTFNPGQTTQNITVNIASDSIDEGNETFSVGLVNPTNATIADSAGTGTITNVPVNITDNDFNEITGGPARDTIRGTSGPDRITGGGGRDTITGGGGSDQFAYSNLLDAGDIITDFMAGEDQIDLSAVLTQIGYSGSDPIGDGYISFREVGDDRIIQIDLDGSGTGRARSFLLIQGVAAAALNNSDNFIF